MRQKTIEKRKKFLAVGRELFFEKGYINVSVKEICDKLETTTGSFYFMFSSKEKLLEELLLEDLNDLWQIGTDVKKEDLDLRGKLNLYFRKAFDFISREIELMFFYESLLIENGIGGKTAQQIKEISLKKQEDGIFDLFDSHREEINHDDSMIKSLARYTVLIFQDKYEEIISKKRNNNTIDENSELKNITGAIEGLIKI